MRFTSFLCSVALAACSAADASQPVLRVCSDPNNLPFSNEKGEGFENAVARLVANDLGAKLEYTWFPQRRGFIRNTLKAQRCDLVIGVPAGYELVAPTRPYYRSTYVFVSRADRLQRLGQSRRLVLVEALHAKLERRDRSGGQGPLEALREIATNVERRDQVQEA